MNNSQNKETIIRAWKDPEFRNNLNEAELASIPEHPAGIIQLSDDELSDIAGGSSWSYHYTCTSSCHLWH